MQDPERTIAIAAKYEALAAEHDARGLGRQNNVAQRMREEAARRLAELPPA